MTESQKKALYVLRKYRNVLDEEVQEMSAWEIWREVEKERKHEREQTRVAEVCVTGFQASERARIEAGARKNNMDVKKSVTKNLTILVCGPNAGPQKIKDAEARGVIIVTGEQFEEFLQTGEIPASEAAQ